MIKVYSVMVLIGIFYVVRCTVGGKSLQVCLDMTYIAIKNRYGENSYRFRLILLGKKGQCGGDDC